MSQRFSSLLLAALSCLLTLDRAAVAISIRHDVPPQSYFDLAAQFPAVGRIDLSGVGAWCTGTLVEPNKVLTAAHCTDGYAADEFTFMLGENVGVPSHSRTLTALSVSPDYIGNERSDLSVLTLSAPITSVDPMPITSLPPGGSIGTMVGYGDHGDGVGFNSAFDHRKRAAQNHISVANNLTLRSDFDHPNGMTSTFAPDIPLPLEGTTAGGDSGGPITVDFGSGEMIVGVLHGGFNTFGPASRYGDISIWTPINRMANIGYLEGQGLTVLHSLTPQNFGDFDQDGAFTCADINALTNAIATDSTAVIFDLDGSGSIDLLDRDQWLANAGAATLASGNPFTLGDLNLDGVTDGVDFVIWNTNKFTSSNNYCDGDINADGVVDGVDFLEWNSNKFTIAATTGPFAPGALRPGAGQVVPVPEPHVVGFCLALALSVILRRQHDSFAT